MRSMSVGSYSFAGIAAGVLLTTAFAPSQATIAVNEPRPLAAAIRQLEDRFGWIVTYEDPPYMHPSEMTDFTGGVRKEGELRRPTQVPRTGRFTFTYPAPPGGRSVSQAEQGALLQALLDEYHRSGNDGVFALSRTGDTAHVVPTMAKDAAGTLRPYRPPLDRAISIPDGDRAVAEMLNAILEAVNAGGESRVGLATAPTNLIMQTRIQGGAQNEPARAVLVRTLAATKRRVSWKLFCQPGTPSCFLNAHLVDRP